MFQLGNRICTDLQTINYYLFICVDKNYEIAQTWFFDEVKF